MRANELPRRNVRQVVNEAAGGNNALPMPNIREEEADLPDVLPFDVLPVLELIEASDDEDDNQQEPPDIIRVENQDNEQDQNGQDGNDENDAEVAQLNRNEYPQEIVQDLRLGAVNNVFVGNEGVQERPVNVNEQRGAVPFLFYQRQDSNEDNGDNRNSFV